MRGIGIVSSEARTWSFRPGKAIVRPEGQSEHGHSWEKTMSPAGRRTQAEAQTRLSRPTAGVQGGGSCV